MDSARDNSAEAMIPRQEVYSRQIKNCSIILITKLVFLLSFKIFEKFIIRQGKSRTKNADFLKLVLMNYFVLNFFFWLYYQENKSKFSRRFLIFLNLLLLVNETVLACFIPLSISNILNFSFIFGFFLLVIISNALKQSFKVGNAVIVGLFLFILIFIFTMFFKKDKQKSIDSRDILNLNGLIFCSLVCIFLTIEFGFKRKFKEVSVLNCSFLIFLKFFDGIGIVIKIVSNDLINPPDDSPLVPASASILDVSQQPPRLS